MNKRLIITMCGIAALAIYAVLEKLPVMFVSAGTIAIVIYVFRYARTRDRVVAIVAAGVGGGIAAEIAYSIYRHTVAAGSAATADSGELFMMAILLGVINAAAVIVLVSLTEICLRYTNRNSE